MIRTRLIVYGMNTYTLYHLTGFSLAVALGCRPMIKVIVALIFKGWDCFRMCAEQIVPVSSCDQDFSTFPASLNYCRRCARLLLTELIYYLLVFLL